MSKWVNREPVELRKWLAKQRAKSKGFSSTKNRRDFHLGQEAISYLENSPEMTLVSHKVRDYFQKDWDVNPMFGDDERVKVFGRFSKRALKILRKVNKDIKSSYKYLRKKTDFLTKEEADRWEKADDIQVARAIKKYVATHPKKLTKGGKLSRRGFSAFQVKYQSFLTKQKNKIIETKINISQKIAKIKKSELLAGYDKPTQKLIRKMWKGGRGLPSWNQLRSYSIKKWAESGGLVHGDFTKNFAKYVDDFYLQHTVFEIESKIISTFLDEQRLISPKALALAGLIIGSISILKRQKEGLSLKTPFPQVIDPVVEEGTSYINWDYITKRYGAEQAAKLFSVLPNHIQKGVMNWGKHQASLTRTDELKPGFSSYGTENIKITDKEMRFITDYIKKLKPIKGLPTPKIPKNVK